MNRASDEVNRFVFEETRSVYAEGKIPGVVGGDHSVPLGAFRACAEKYREGFGILHFDAHLDTRDTYEGFQYSHASIMRNALDEVAGIKKLVQGGIRDYCEEEVSFNSAQGERVKVFYDR